MHTPDFLSYVIKRKSFPHEIRLYLIDGNKHYFINEGILKRGFNSKLSIAKNRDSLLSAFSKMIFLFDEIIRLRIVGFYDDRKNEELIYLTNLIPVNRKIRNIS